MSTIETKYFNAMPFDEALCFEFPWGLPAFEEERLFLPLQTDAHKPLVFLQSAITSSLCFIAVPILIADPAYQLAVCTDDLEALGLRVDRQPAIGVDVLVFALLSIQENAPTTANLLAPVVINLSTRHGLQAIRYDAVYSHAQALTLRTGECSC